VVVSSYLYLEFKGTIIAIIMSVLSIQELVVCFMIVYKIRNARPPSKVQFIDRRYFDPEIELEMQVIFDEQ
jgi:hypothetical protein